MSIKSLLDRISISIQLCSPEDETALAQLLEEIKTLRDEWKTGGPEGLESELDQALAIAERLVDAKPNASTADLAQIEGYVTSIMNALGMDCEPSATVAEESHSAAETAPAAKPTDSAGDEEADDDQIDSELLSLFLGGCEEAISKLEHGLIELEEKPGQPDVLGEVRG
ncbi:MAG: hypothetical protein ACI835_005205, partial [Planctomycetota bacterium]